MALPEPPKNINSTDVQTVAKDHRTGEREGGREGKAGESYFQTSCSRSAAAAAAVRREAGMGVSHWE